MAKHIVTCRICKEKFDAKEEERATIWIMPSKNCYYHKDCYDNWKGASKDINLKKNDEIWIDYIWDYISRDLKKSYDYQKANSQRKNFINSKGYTNKGIFFALRYAYEIKKINIDKSNGGIGIVPYVYQESILYWSTMQRNQKDLLLKIEEQMEKLRTTDKKIIKKKKKKKEWVDKTDEILGGLNE